jgi:hypothetical protein
MNTESMYSNQCMLNLVRLFNLFAFYTFVTVSCTCMFMLLSCLCLCVSMTSFVQDNHISFARAVNQITVILALHVYPGSCVDACDSLDTVVHNTNRLNPFLSAIR